MLLVCFYHIYWLVSLLRLWCSLHVPVKYSITFCEILMKRDNFFHSVLVRSSSTFETANNRLLILKLEGAKFHYERNDV